MSPAKKPQSAGSKRGAPSSGRQAAVDRTRRIGLIVFGGIALIFLLAFAIFRGLGPPGVPSGDVAVVQDAPPGLGTVTRPQYDQAVLQAAASAGVQKLPAPGSSAYENLKQSALGNLFDAIWIQGEAAKEGITASPQEIAAQLKQIKAQNFKSPGQFEQFLKRSHFTPQDVNTRVKLQILSQKIQQKVTQGVKPVSSGAVSDYYNAAKQQFKQPETRDVRLILNKNQAQVLQAKAALQQSSSVASWKAAAARYSSDPASKNNGGLRAGLTQGLLEQGISQAIFSAPQGQIQGPVKTPLGYYVFQVEKVNPASTQAFSQVKAQIQQQLNQQAQQNTFQTFVNNYGSTWSSRTFCASGYVITRCANAAVFTLPQNAPPGCFQAHAQGARPAACPAPVQLPSPALPGTITLINPSGTQLPQRPIPAGLKQLPTSGGLPGALPGAVTPGATAPGAAGGAGGGAAGGP